MCEGRTYVRQCPPQEHQARCHYLKKGHTNVSPCRAFTGNQWASLRWNSKLWPIVWQARPAVARREGGARTGCYLCRVSPLSYIHTSHKAPPLPISETPHLQPFQFTLPTIHFKPPAAVEAGPGCSGEEGEEGWEQNLQAAFPSALLSWISPPSQHCLQTHRSLHLSASPEFCHMQYCHLMASPCADRQEPWQSPIF